MSTLWGAWAPPNERSRLAGIANAGAQIGNVSIQNNKRIILTLHFKLEIIILF